MCVDSPYNHGPEAVETKETHDREAVGFNLAGTTQRLSFTLIKIENSDESDLSDGSDGSDRWLFMAKKQQLYGKF